MEISCEQSVRVNLVHYPVTVLGPGARVGVWFQGCSLSCRGCIASHTWDKNAGYSLSLDVLVEELCSHEASVTISGGEPLEQPEMLYKLVKELKLRNREILLYTGYSFEYISKRFFDILQYIDVVIDGDFRKEQPTELSYKGSKNQRIFILTENNSIIEEYQDWSKKSDKNLQVIQQNDNLFVLGIPDIKDSRRIMNAAI